MNNTISINIQLIYDYFRSFLKRNFSEIIKWCLLLPLPILIGVFLGIKETAVEGYSNFLLKVASGEKKAFWRAVIISLGYALIVIPCYLPSVKDRGWLISLIVIGINALVVGIQCGAIIVENKLSGYLLFLLILIPVCLLLSFFAICFTVACRSNSPCSTTVPVGSVIAYLAAVFITTFLFYIPVLSFLKLFC